MELMSSVGQGGAEGGKGKLGGSLECGIFICLFILFYFILYYFILFYFNLFYFIFFSFFFFFLSSILDCS